jgi:hypothetical protein
MFPSYLSPTSQQRSCWLRLRILRSSPSHTCYCRRVLGHCDSLSLRLFIHFLWGLPAPDSSMTMSLRSTDAQRPPDECYAGRFVGWNYHWDRSGGSTLKWHLMRSPSFRCKNTRDFVRRLVKAHLTASVVETRWVSIYLSDLQLSRRPIGPDRLPMTVIRACWLR